MALQVECERRIAATGSAPMQAMDVMRKVQAVQTNQCGLLACPPLVCFCSVALLASQHLLANMLPSAFNSQCGSPTVPAVCHVLANSSHESLHSRNCQDHLLGISVLGCASLIHGLPESIAVRLTCYWTSQKLWCLTSQMADASREPGRP